MHMRKRRVKEDSCFWSMAVVPLTEMGELREMGEIGGRVSCVEGEPEVLIWAY